MDPDRRDSGDKVIWTSGVIFGKGEVLNFLNNIGSSSLSELCLALFFLYGTLDLFWSTRVKYHKTMKNNVGGYKGPTPRHLGLVQNDQFVFLLAGIVG